MPFKAEKFEPALPKRPTADLAKAEKFGKVILTLR